MADLVANGARTAVLIEIDVLFTAGPADRRLAHIPIVPDNHIIGLVGAWHQKSWEQGLPGRERNINLIAVKESGDRSSKRRPVLRWSDTGCVRSERAN